MNKPLEQMLDDARLEVIVLQNQKRQEVAKANCASLSEKNAVELMRVWMCCACLSFGMLLFFILRDWI